MKKSWIIAVVCLAALAGAAFAATQDRAEIITTSRADTVSAANDGQAWVLTSRGTVMYCRFEESSKVRCYDRAGAVDSGY